MEPTEKQISYIVWRVNAEREFISELKEAFPDDIGDGVNKWRLNLEQKLQSLSRQTASEIISLLQDEDEQGFILLIKELNQINR